MAVGERKLAQPRTPLTPAAVPPRLDRAVELHFKGDGGLANLHRVGGWIADQVVARSAPGSRVAVWTGTGFLSNICEVAAGLVDLTAATPTCAVAVARDGRQPGVEAMPSLQALGVIPQFDRLVCAVRRDTGLTSFADIVENKFPLRISAARDDGESWVGRGSRVLMEGLGIDAATLEDWGGRYIDFTDATAAPPGAVWTDRIFGALCAGEADAVIMEAIMVPVWQELAVDPGLTFLSLDGATAERIEATTGWPTAEVPAGYFPGQVEPVTALEFSDFVVVCRADLPEDVAHLIAWSLGETRSVFEAQYHHIPPERSPVTYPLDPIVMGSTTRIPLHPGAAKYYDSLA